jgi:hypothetical protein
MSDLELLENLTESDIEAWFDTVVLAKAWRLYHSDRVYGPVRQDTTLSADVLGNDGLNYTVTISATADGVQAGCDCGGEYVCEHIGAVLLNWIRTPEDFVSYDDAFSADFLDYVQGPVVDVEDEESTETDERGLLSGGTLPNLGDATGLIGQSTQIVEKELSGLLWEQTVQQLRAIARRRGWNLRGTHKEGLVSQLVHFYLDAQDTADTIAALDDDRRLTLEVLALRATAMPVSESVVNKTIRNLTRRPSKKEAADVLQDLRELGLVFATKGHYYRMPAAVHSQLPPWPALLAPYEGDPENIDVRQSPTFALTEVAYQVWQYLRESPSPKKSRKLPRPTRMEKQWPTLRGWLNPPAEVAEMERSGSRFWYNPWQQSIGVLLLPTGLSDGDLAELRQRTDVNDDIMTFAFSLLTGLGFVQWKYGSDIRADEDGMTAFLTYSDADRQRMLTTTWLNQDWWTEMALVLQHLRHLTLRRNLGQFDLRYSDLTQELARARLIVVMLLRRLLPGTWYSAADFRHLLRHFWPDYLHAASMSSTQRWWLTTADSDYRLSPSKAADWEVGYAPFITACLEGPLAWLGVVRLGYDRKGLAAFQITELGAYLLGLQTSYSHTTDKLRGPALAIHGDGTVIAVTGYAITGAYNLLNVIADLSTTSAHQFQYHISAATAQHAFEQGWTGPAILNELERHSDEPVPEPLRSHILSWAEGYGQVHLYDEVTLVEFADDFALQELLASTSLAQHLVYEFSPRMVAIKTEAVDALREELVRLGHTPRIE